MGIAGQDHSVALHQIAKYQKIISHVRALELSSTRKGILWTKCEVEWRQQSLDRSLKQLKNMLAWAEAKAKKTTKSDDTD